MVSLDFEYDNRFLSDYNFIICDFNYSDGANEVDVGSNITFNKISLNNGKMFGLSSTQYENCITTTFDICKDPELFEINDRVISDEEYLDLFKWLNRHQYLKLQFIDDHFPFCYFNASFNISKILINGNLYGLRLIMETDKPFGYGETVVREKTFTSSGQSICVKNISQELGYIYPIIKVEATQNGNITITNSTTESTILIKNCVMGEKIEINGETQIIKTSNNNHKISNDFNYEFLPLRSTLDNNRNTITATPCKLTIEYNPIIKNISY